MRDVIRGGEGDYLASDEVIPYLEPEDGNSEDSDGSKASWNEEGSC